MSIAKDPVFSGPSPDAIYQAYLERGEFRIQRCARCGRYIFYPRLTCTGCGGAGMEWVVPTGRGSVYAVSIINRKAEKGGPHNVVLVDLAEGPRMMGRVDGVANEAVKIGMAVKARIDRNGQAPLIVFEPA